MTKSFFKMLGFLGNGNVLRGEEDGSAASSGTKTSPLSTSAEWSAKEAVSSHVIRLLVRSWEEAAHPHVLGWTCPL